MFSELSHNLVHFVITYGYFAIFFITLGESMGLLLPAETALISASIYAGTTHHLNIFFVILAAILGAIIGDNIGYAIGRFGGYTLLKRYGK